ncbi:Putative sugar lactone lactonase YvrE-like protein [Cladobotryum mycophilum]|uniref:Sugar lactone lactonase YvrE-like protein n=1 Tax=Cladobotryum mycophilum TaxID=491253 RepID=A0ABR0SE47_9HYPO
MSALGIQEWTVDKPWLDLHCALGEGPFYEQATNSIRFVDIKRKQLHSVSVHDGGDGASLQTIQLDICPTVTADIAGVDPRDRILLGVKYGIAVLDRRTGAYEMLAEFDEERNERLRSNDGAADPHGRFWLGSMTDFVHGDVQPEGSLFRFQASNTRDKIIGELSIPNSVGWSPDSKIMYFTHSRSREVFALDYSPETGHVTNKRLWYQHDGPGEPDGFRVDINGNIWHAVYGESLVLKINPGGKVVGKIYLPTRNITCVQFVGTELIITSAADGEGEETSKKYGGAVFRVDVGTTGLDLFNFKM